MSPTTKGTGTRILAQEPRTEDIVFTSNITVGSAFKLPGLGLFQVIKPSSQTLETYAHGKEDRVFLRQLNEEEFDDLDQSLIIDPWHLPPTDASRDILQIGFNATNTKVFS